MNTPEDTPAARIGILTTDTQLVIKSWDAALERMTGIPAERARGQQLQDLVPDLRSRILLDLLREPLVSGSAQVLAPAIHKYLIPCAPLEPSKEFAHMQQRVVVGALRDDAHAVGLVMSIEDVTARLERERQLARQLHGADPAARIQAVHQLSPLESPDDLGPLGGVIGDEDWQVRRAAVRALATRRDASLVDAVVTALRDGHRDFSLLSSALQLLTLTGVDLTDALVGLMRDPDTDLRIQAALALGTQRRPEATAALLAALDDPDTNVRFHAVEALGKLAPPSAITPLLTIAESGDFFLAFAAIEALVRINDPMIAPRLVPLLSDSMLSSAAAEALGRLGDEDAVLPLVEALAQPVVPAPMVPLITDALAAIHRRYQSLFDGAEQIEECVRQRITPAGFQRMIDAMGHASGASLRNLILVMGWLRDNAVPAALARFLGSSDVHHEVVEALVRFGAPVVDLLVEQLNSDDADGRRTAAVALGRIGDRKAVPALVELLGDDDRSVLVPAAGALARLGDPRAFAPLMELLGDRDAGVRQAAIGALNSIGHPGMAGQICAKLDDPDPIVRESAVKIAGYFGYAECVDAVFARCTDSHESVRVAAIEHLPYFDDPRDFDVLAAALVKETPRVRAAAAQALGALPGIETLERLHHALADAEPWVRYYSAISLGKIGDSSSTARLAPLAAHDPVEHVRVAAIEAIGALGGADAAHILQPVVTADEGDSGHAAVRVMGRLAGAEVLATLQTALRSTDSARRMAAVEALAVCGDARAVDELLWTTSADVDESVSSAAFGALIGIASKETDASGPAVRAMISTLAEPARRAERLTALARLSPSAIPTLAESLESDDPQTRRTVVDALARLSHPVASAYLQKALTDADAVVRRQSIAALSRIGTRGLAPRLSMMAEKDPSAPVRQAAALALHRGLDAGRNGGE